MSNRRGAWVIEKIGIDFVERRSYKRARGMLPGCLSYGEDGRTADCVVLDISVTGAMIKFDDHRDIENFCRCSEQGLQISDAINFPVEVVWQEGSRAGLHFRADPSDVVTALEDLVRMGSTAIKRRPAD